jgi:hypothetical protein
VGQILCGVNAITFYSSELFKDPHATNNYEIFSEKAAWLSFGKIPSILIVINC